jgi:hypothetical protein
MAAAVMFLVVLLVGLAIPIALWALVERETENRPVTDRATAERQVRNDAGRGPGGRTATDRPESDERDTADDPWGHDDEWGR